MAQIAAAIAQHARAGDCIALTGDLGAGKTSFARAFIRALADDPALDVPSPTFTLVQTYATDPPVSHFDFYRLSEPGEVDELGLAEALEAGIALVEWPERAAQAVPDEAIGIAFEETADGDARTLIMTAPVSAVDRLLGAAGQR